MGCWTHLHLEAYCMYKSMCCKIFKTVSIEFVKGKMISTPNKEVSVNNHYVPKKERPVWCKNKNKKFVPQFKCMCNGKKDVKCPFFAFTDANRKDYKIFDKAWEKEIKNGNT